MYVCIRLIGSFFNPSQDRSSDLPVDDHCDDADGLEDVDDHGDAAGSGDSPLRGEKLVSYSPFSGSCVVLCVFVWVSFLAAWSSQVNWQRFERSNLHKRRIQIIRHLLHQRARYEIPKSRILVQHVEEVFPRGNHFRVGGVQTQFSLQTELLHPVDEVVATEGAILVEEFGPGGRVLRGEGLGEESR